MRSFDLELIFLISLSSSQLLILNTKKFNLKKVNIDVVKENLKCSQYKDIISIWIFFYMLSCLFIRLFDCLTMYYVYTYINSNLETFQILYS